MRRQKGTFNIASLELTAQSSLDKASVNCGNHAIFAGHDADLHHHFRNRALCIDSWSLTSPGSANARYRSGVSGTWSAETPCCLWVESATANGSCLSKRISKKPINRTRDGKTRTRAEQGCSEEEASALVSCLPSCMLCWLLPSAVLWYPEYYLRYRAEVLLDSVCSGQVEVDEGEVFRDS